LPDHEGGLAAVWVSEQILYSLAKFLSKGELAHSQEMKQALSGRAEYARYRQGQLDLILAAAEKCGIDIRNQVVLDLGCSDGAITAGYLRRGARRVIGVDIDEAAIAQAKEQHSSPDLSFQVSGKASLPLADALIDVVVCYDVFEHVSQPAAMLEECRRVLKPGGKALIGTWGWYHPFAPHLWSTLPVPWAHIFFSERTMLRACRRVYNASWYVPNMHDLDENGEKIKGKYQQVEISREYLNKVLVRDFEKLFRREGFACEVFPQPFGSRLARWTRVFLHTPWIREFITGYLWAVLTRQPEESEFALSA
jgi:SAM-dependent methyltransferase